MIIQHNIMALNSNNRLAGNNSQVAKNLEKLSSGYKINRAGDDAAGLAISEKMRAQITGLTRASQNAQDGVSLVQTAEGNLTEVHSMLNRMVDLATQSSNGTYEGNVDRKNLQKEVQALKDEINRIADTSNFNGIKLLDGSLSGGTTSINGGKIPFKLSEAQHAGIATTQPTATTSNITFAALTDAETAANEMKATFTFADAKGSVKEFTVTLKTDLANKKIMDADGNVLVTTTAADGNVSAAELSEAFAAALNKNESFKTSFGTADGTTTAGKIAFTSPEKGSNGSKALNTSFTYNDGSANKTAPLATVATPGNDKFYGIAVGGTNEVNAYNGTGNVNDYVFEVDGKKFAFVTSGNEGHLGKDVNYVITTGGTPTITANGEMDKMAALIGQKTGISGITVDNTNGVINFSANTKTSGGGLNLQIGDTADQRVSVVIGDMGVSALGLDAVDVSTEETASASMQMIKDAINSVSGTRADLGAVQNRLEHTINNLTTTTENMTAAESRIRDTNMAQEMMAFTKNNVLAQAAQAMLAQANQQPQQVLQLLR